MARTTIEYTKIRSTDPDEITDPKTNDLLYKLKLAFLGNDESIMDYYDMLIEFYDYDNSISFYDILELAYDEIVIKRNNLLNHVKTTTDDLVISTYTKKIKYSPDDIYGHQIEFDLRGHSAMSDVSDPRFNREYVNYLRIDSVGYTTLLSISIDPKADEEE